MLIKETFVDIQTQNGLMRLLLIIPVTNIKNPKFPAILVFTEIYQITGPVKRFCARIASQGYIVACPESYHEFLPIGTVIPYDQIGTDLGNTLIEKHLHSYDNDVTSILNYLTTHPNCTGQFGATGMCLGGHLAFRAAFDPRIKSTVCFFATDIHSETLGKGKRSDSLKRSAEIKGELLMIFGKQDTHIPQAGRTQIYNQLVTNNITFSWCEFQAQHAFIRDEKSKDRYDAALTDNCFHLLKELFFRTLYVTPHPDLQNKL
ncbi:Alpha/Beta hydrolase protein [Globomyces pollinis-pini]|nr:Alpha/Beta hydrolase protein [Globomyces pollinis-pini]